MEPRSILLPPMGEGVSEGTVIALLVKEGETIQPNQSIAEIESDKVTLELPAEEGGLVVAILVHIGQKVKVGDPILRLQAAAKQEESSAAETIQPPAQVDFNPVSEVPLLAETSRAELPSLEASVMPSSTTHIRATPLARKLARELGVDLGEITAEKHRIFVQDVKKHIKQKMQAAAHAPLSGMVRPLPDLSKFGPIETQTLNSIGVATAENMQASWQLIPHAWLTIKADVTELEAKRQKYKAQVAAQNGSLTLTALLVQICSKALQAFPIFNSSYDAVAQNVVLRKYIHLGVAMDTQKGLLVPAIKHANEKGLSEIAIELKHLSDLGKKNRLQVTDLQGVTFSISNLGSMGVGFIFPLINFPQVAILGVGLAQTEAFWNGETFLPKPFLPLTLAFDHRLINGADAAQFLDYIRERIEDPFLLNL